MKIYVAAPFAARDLGVLAAQQLQRAGHECTSSWLLSTRPIEDSALGPSWDTSDEGAREHALGDFDDVKRADALLHLTAGYVLGHGVPDTRLHTGGRHTEIGFAIALGKIIVSLGEPENIFQRALCHNVTNMVAAITALEAAAFAREQMKGQLMLGQLESKAQLEALLE